MYSRAASSSRLFRPWLAVLELFLLGGGEALGDGIAVGVAA
jgi:hypothetical protein